MTTWAWTKKLVGVPFLLLGLSLMYVAYLCSRLRDETFWDWVDYIRGDEE